MELQNLGNGGFGTDVRGGDFIDEERFFVLGIDGRFSPSAQEVQPEEIEALLACAECALQTAQTPRGGASAMPFAAQTTPARPSAGQNRFAGAGQVQTRTRVQPQLAAKTSAATRDWRVTQVSMQLPPLKPTQAPRNELAAVPRSAIAEAQGGAAPAAAQSRKVCVEYCLQIIRVKKVVRLRMRYASRDFAQASVRLDDAYFMANASAPQFGGMGCGTFFSQTLEPNEIEPPPPFLMQTVQNAVMSLMRGQRK